MKNELTYKTEISTYMYSCELDENMKPMSSFIKKKIINKSPSISDLAFYHIMKNNKHAIMELIRNEGTEFINTRNENYDTCADLAVQYGRYSILQILLNNGADKMLVNPTEKTNLYGEVCHHYISYKIFHLLWKDIEDFDFVKKELIKDNDEHEPLMTTLIKNEKNFQKVNFFIKKFGSDFSRLAMQYTQYASEIPLKIDFLLCGKYTTQKLIRQKTNQKKPQSDKKVMKI